MSSTNIRPHLSAVTENERYALLKQQPVTVWLTGLSGAGKSTLAYALEKQLVALGHACYVLDGDNVRHGLNANLGFTDADRTENIRRVAEVAKLMNQAGLVVISAFISPTEVDRAMAKSIIGTARFLEVHVSTPLQVCESRDAKGFYQLARQGKITHFTGVSAPYEPPSQPHLRLDTSNASVEEHLHALLNVLMPYLTTPNP